MTDKAHEATHKLSDKLRAKVERMYSGADKERVIKQLEDGKTVMLGGSKLKADKVEKTESDNTVKSEKVSTPPVTTSVKTPAPKETDNK